MHRAFSELKTSVPASKPRFFQLLGLLVLAITGSVSAAPPDDLAAGFASPPDSDKPLVWWHWVDGNISKQGITADLNAMKNAGIGSATIVSVKFWPGGKSVIPDGQVKFLSNPWMDLVHFSATEADRLGLKMGISNAEGWSNSGGPWITPEHAMQVVTTGEKQVKGPIHFSDTLPSPPQQIDFYRDIAVIAFPTPVGELTKMSDAAPKITSSAPNLDVAKLVSGNPKTPAVVPRAIPGKPQYIQFEFAQPYAVRTVAMMMTDQATQCAAQLDASDDGITFHTIRPIEIQAHVIPWGAGWQSYAVKETTARFFRLTFNQTRNNSSNMPIAALDLSPRLSIDSFAIKANYAAGGPHEPAPAPFDPSFVIDPAKIVDLTNMMDASGKLTWDVPAGNWTILRVGHTAINSKDFPSSPEGTGLECDKLDREAVTSHWAGFLAKVVANVGPLAGKSFDNTLIDSYEVGDENWTPKMREEFSKRRSYDLLPYLPTFTGRVVGSPEQSDRFLWDLRRTTAELFAENYYGYMATLARQSGLTLSVEPYGSGPAGPANCIDGARGVDKIMGEIWVGQADQFLHTTLADVRSASHLYGKQLVNCEFATEKAGKWADSPMSLKPLADVTFAAGINQLTFASFVHQPQLDPRPGLTLERFGSNISRGNTWWNQSAGWFQYITRCQYLLRQGHPVADILYLEPEWGIPMDPALIWPPVWPMTPPLPEGYAYDKCTDDAIFNRFTVKDGRLTLPDGTSYGVLVLPAKRETMTPELLRKIKEFSDAGVTILGPKPSRSPSLSGYPQCDEEIKSTADALWNSGKIASADTLPQALLSLGATPDTSCSDASIHLNWIHRMVGDFDIYFIANPKDEWVSTDGLFRVSGKTPEFWHPESGEKETAAIYDVQGKQTRVPLRLEPNGSVFVVFRPTTSTDHPVSLTRTDTPASTAVPSDFPEARLKYGGDHLMLEAWNPGTYQIKMAQGSTLSKEVKDGPLSVDVTGPWNLTFPPDLGAPAQATFDSLSSWSNQADPGIKYFSGTAIYHKTFTVPQAMLRQGSRLYLDLGDVQVLASVKLNGKDLGVLWKKPFSMDITDAAKPGDNSLEIAVTNLWPNRLIGDEQLPADPLLAGNHWSQWPQWWLDGTPDPTGRVAFTSWYHWKKTDTLLPSGLIGPVTLRSSAIMPVP